MGWDLDIGGQLLRATEPLHRMYVVEELKTYIAYRRGKAGGGWSDESITKSMRESPAYKEGEFNDTHIKEAFDGSPRPKSKTGKYLLIGLGALALGAGAAAIFNRRSKQ